MVYKFDVRFSWILNFRLNEKNISTKEASIISKKLVSFKKRINRDLPGILSRLEKEKDFSVPRNFIIYLILSNSKSKKLLISRKNMWDPLVIECNPQDSLMFLWLVHEIIHLCSKKRFKGDAKKAHEYYNLILQELFLDTDYENLSDKFREKIKKHYSKLKDKRNKRNKAF
jgi:hypothetical protein